MAFGESSELANTPATASMADAITPLLFGVVSRFAEDAGDFRRLDVELFFVVDLVVDFVDFAGDFEDFVLDDADLLREAEVPLDFAFVAPDDLGAVVFLAVEEVEDERPVDLFDAGLDFELDDFAELVLEPDDLPDPDFELVDFLVVGILVPPVSKFVQKKYARISANYMPRQRPMLCNFEYTFRAKSMRMTPAVRRTINTLILRELEVQEVWPAYLATTGGVK